MVRLKKSEVFLCLDAFRNDAQFKTAADVDDGGQDGGFVGSCAELADE